MIFLEEIYNLFILRKLSDKIVYCSFNKSMIAPPSLSLYLLPFDNPIGRHDLCWEEDMGMGAEAATMPGQDGGKADHE